MFESWQVLEPIRSVGNRDTTDEGLPVLDVNELGRVVGVSSIKELKAAIDDVRAHLDCQRIAWVEGHHLPQQLELRDLGNGARWAGSDN